MLSEIVKHDPQQLGKQAKAAYLITYCDVSPGRAHEGTEALGAECDETQDQQHQ
jgi:hypothetical protein